MIPLVISSLLWARPCDLLLRNNVRQKGWVVSLKVVIKNWPLLPLLLSLTLLLTSILHAPFDEASCWNHERSLGINSLWIEALTPTCKELNPDINHVSELGGRLFPNWLWDGWLQLARDSIKIEVLAKQWLGSWPPETMRFNLCCFKPLNFGVICHVAIGNRYSCQYIVFSYIQNTSSRVWLQEALLVLVLIPKIQVLLNLEKIISIPFYVLPNSPYFKNDWLFYILLNQINSEMLSSLTISSNHIFKSQLKYITVQIWS